MKEIEGKSKFGPASGCKSVEEAIDFLPRLIGDDAVKITVAYAMEIAANSTEGGKR